MGLHGAGYVSIQCPNPTVAATQLQELTWDSIKEVGQQSGLDEATNLAENLAAAAQWV